MGKVSSLQR